MIVVGLGKAGINVSKIFERHDQYNILLLDENNGIESRSTVEEYDAHPVSIDPNLVKDEREGILFLCGSGKIAGASLRVLEALSSIEMTVFYIIPDLEFASREEILRNNAHYNILQQYARSGKIKNIILSSNKEMISQVGTGVLSKYYEKVNFHIYSIVQNVMFCMHTSPEFGALQKPKEYSRISTLGYGKVDDNEESFLFPLDNITETCYLFNISEDDLDNDDSLLTKIQAKVRNNRSDDRDASYAIWKSSGDHSDHYSIHYTHYIQQKDLGE